MSAQDSGRTAVEADAKSADHAAATPEPTRAPAHDPLPHTFGGPPGQPPDATRRLFRTPNSTLRTTVFRRAQQTHGNRFVQRSGSVAARAIQRACACGGTCERCAAASTHAPAVVPSEIVPSASVGDPLAPADRERQERRLHADFGDVRVHTDAASSQAADDLSADAFATGSDVYFAAGKFAPGSSSGDRLLTHELVHTLQQRRDQTPSRLAASLVGGYTVADVDDPLEEEAERVADALALDPGADVSPGAGPPHIQRQPAGTPDVRQPSVVVVTNQALSIVPPGGDAIGRYPALAVQLDEKAYDSLRKALRARDLSKEIGELEAAAKPDHRRLADLKQERRRLGATTTAVQVPITKLLASDAVGGSSLTFREDVVAQLRQQRQIFTLLKDETLSRFKLGYYPDSLMVTVAVVDPKAATAAPTSLSFTAGVYVVESKDGYLRLADLDRAAKSPLESIAKQVFGDAAGLGELASLLAGAPSVAADLEPLAKDIKDKPEEYAVKEVQALIENVDGWLSAMKRVDAGTSKQELDGYTQKLSAVRDRLGEALTAAKTIQVKNRCESGAENVKKVSDQFNSDCANGSWGACFAITPMMGPGGGSMPVSPASYKIADLVTAGAFSDMDNACLAFRAGMISLSARDKLTRHAAYKGAVALGLSFAAGMFGGWVGGVLGRAVFGAGTIGAALTTSTIAGSFGGLGLVGGQDLYNWGARTWTDDRFVRAYMQPMPMSAYGQAAGFGALMGLPFGALHYYGATPRAPGAPGLPPAAEPVVLYDASNRMIRVLGGEILPPRPGPVTLQTPTGTVRVQGGQVLPGAAPTIYLPGQGVPSPGQLPLSTLRAASAGEVTLLDAAGRPISVTQGPTPQAPFQTRLPGQTTLLNEPRIVTPGGASTGSQVPPPTQPLVDPFGSPLPATGTGPVIIDLQAGTPAHLRQLTAGTPGSTGIGVEPGNWMLAYQGIYPADPRDLAMAQMIARNTPAWPNTPAWRTSLGGMPRALPWEIDPATNLFPTRGPVVMLADPANPLLGQSFFPPFGGAQQPFGARQVPFGLKDISGFQPTTSPQLAGVADRVLLRRPFGTGLADRETTVAMGRELNGLLNPNKPNAYVEIRITRASELSVPTDQNPGALDQPAIIAEQIQGARVERVSGTQINNFRKTGQFPPGTNAAQQDMIREAAADVQGLGEGQFSRVVRIYRGATISAPPTPPPAVQRHADSNLAGVVNDAAIPAGGGGTTFDGAARHAAESSFAVSFDAVRIHDDAASARAAEGIAADAFTVGRDIYFGAGKYEPGTPEGLHLIAHELTHVVQQASGRGPTPGPSLFDAPTSLSEREAETAADGVLRAADIERSIAFEPRSLATSIAALGTQGLKPRFVQRQADLTGASERVSTSAESKGGVTLGVPPQFANIAANEWLRRNGDRLATELRELLLATTFAVPIPEMHWRVSVAEFVRMLSQNFGLDATSLSWTLGRVLAPDSLRQAVDMGRDAYPAEYGPPGWVPGVAPEVGRLLIRRIVESFSRVGARVARTAVRRAPKAVPPAGRAPSAAGTAGLTSPGPIVSVNLTPDIGAPFSLFSGGGAPPTVQGAFAHPIDPHVFIALIANTEVDVDAYRRNHPQEFTAAALAAEEQPIRRVQFEFQAKYGAPSWIRVIEPPDATREEVAFELFADTMMAHRLQRAGSLFAVPFDLTPAGTPDPRQGGLSLLGLALRPQHAEALLAAIRETGRDPRQATTPDGPLREILSGPLAEEAALRGASNIARTKNATPDIVRDRLGFIVNRLNDMVPPAMALMRPPDASPIEMLASGQIRPYVAPESKRIAERITVTKVRVLTRLKRLASDPTADLLAWDGQSHGQLEIVNLAAAGLGVAAGLAEKFRSWPSIYNLVADIAESYVAAAESSDIYDPARAMLEHAERKSVLFPATAMELLLAQFRNAIDGMRRSKLTAIEHDPDASGQLTELDERERKLRARLAAVRSLLLQNPAAARTEMDLILKEIQDVQVGVTVLGNMDTTDAVWQALFSSTSVVGELRALFPGEHGNTLLRKGMDSARNLNSEWHEIYLEWRYHDKKLAAEQLRKKSKDPTWSTYVHDMRVLMREQAQWDALVTFVALVGIAVLSGGLGLYVEAAAGAAWGAGIGFGLGLATEATAFTLMSYPLTARDPSIEGFFLDLGKNALFIGAGRAIGHGFEALAGAERAATLGGRLVGFAAQAGVFSAYAIHEANQESLRVNGRPLTAEEKAQVALQTLAFMAATAGANRLLKGPLTNLKLSGELSGAEFRLNRSIAQLQTHLNAVEKVENPTKVQRDNLIKAEDDAVSAEQSLLLRIKRIVDEGEALPEKKRQPRLDKLGISTDLARALQSSSTSPVMARVSAMEGMRIYRVLQPVGGGDFAIPADMYEAARGFFRSLPETTVADLETGPVIAVTGVPEVAPGGRFFIVHSRGESFRVFARAAGAQGEIGGAVETKDPGAAQPTSTRTERLRRIAAALSKNRAQIEAMLRKDPAAREAERENAIYATRDPHGASGPPEFEGLVFRDLLSENIAAVAKLHDQIAAAGPDVIVGLERGGAFLARAVTAKDPQMRQRVHIMPMHRAPEGSKGGKFIAADQQAEFLTLIKGGAKRIGIVDTYMGGKTAANLRDQVLGPLMKDHPEAKDVKFEVFWLRETFGYERIGDGTAGKELAPMRTSKASIVFHEPVKVRLALGDDMDVVLTAGSRAPIRVFNEAGQVIEVFNPRPDQTTYDLLIELLSGAGPQLPTPPPSRPVVGGRIPGLPPPFPIGRDDDPIPGHTSH